jgi:RecB family exonuclease
MQMEGLLSPPTQSNRHGTSFSVHIMSRRFRHPPSPSSSLPPHQWNKRGVPFCRSRTVHFSSTRLSSAVKKSTSNININNSEVLPISSNSNDDDELLDPYDILRTMQKLSNKEQTPTIPFPAHFSPTSLEQFHKCPQAFFFQYILKLTPDPPMTPELARGILCHTALEEVFDLRPADRNLTNLENLFRRAWKKVRGERELNNDLAPLDDVVKISNSKEKAQYDVLFRKQDNDDEEGLSSELYDIESEIGWGESSLRLLKNYMELEDPSHQSPLMREMWVHARFPFVDNNSNEHQVDSDFTIKGKIDRIDILPSTSGDKVQLQIIDYKTGKKPWFKYSQSMNDRIFRDQFWKMKVYALILWKMILQTESAATSVDSEAGQQKEQYKYRLSWELQQRLTNAAENTRTNDARWSKMLELNSLRLVHLTSHMDDDSVNNPANSMTGTSSIGKATYLDYALDAPSEFESVILDQTEREVQAIVHGVKKLVDTQSPHAFQHCDWRYCSCHEFRRRFRPGSVYASPDA